jgi:flagellar hook-associated protein 2
MAVNLTGLASGFDWSSFVDQMMEVERAPQRQLRTEQSTLQQRSNAYNSLKTELGVLQGRAAALKDTALYDSRTVSTADATLATAKVDAGAALGSYKLTIAQLATASRLQGAANVGQRLNATSDVSALTLSSAGFPSAVTAGTFTVNGAQVTIATSDTLQAVFDKIATATGNTVSGSYNPDTDKITLTSTSGPVVLGSATDTSNFLQVARLYNNGTATTSSSVALGGVRQTATLASANLTTAISDGGSGAGEFKINGVSITFNASTDTISSVLNRINNSTAGVSASYDSVNDRFVLTNKTTGDMGVAVQDVTGNFLAATGLTTATLSRGSNLQYTINDGDTLISQSNTITEASSGISGLSVTAVAQGTTTITVAADTAKIKTAITSFIDAYNRAQAMIDTQTASSTDAKGVVTAGTLATDSSASDIATRLRSLAFSPISGLTTGFDHLADLGIDTSGDDNKLTLDDSALLDEALVNDPSGVRALFTDATKGVATRLDSYLESTIGESGTLITHQSNLTKQSSDIDTQIADLERIVQANREQMIARFIAMETAQAKLNSQLNFLQSQLGNSSSK